VTERQPERVLARNNTNMLSALKNQALKILSVLPMIGLAACVSSSAAGPLPDAAVDAAVNEWTGGIWELGIGPAMVKEMTRVVRPGGRIAVTHRLVQIPLAQLRQPWVQYEEIYNWMRGGFVHPELTIVAERVWGQIVPSLVGENAAHWRKQYMPRLINPNEVIYECDENPGVRADVYLTIIAHRQ